MRAANSKAENCLSKAACSSSQSSSRASRCNHSMSASSLSFPGAAGAADASPAFNANVHASVAAAEVYTSAPQTQTAATSGARRSLSGVMRASAQRNSVAASARR